MECQWQLSKYHDKIGSQANLGVRADSQGIFQPTSAVFSYASLAPMKVNSLREYRALQIRLRALKSYGSNQIL
jgi:hypothetical protein